MRREWLCSNSPRESPNTGGVAILIRRALIPSSAQCRWEVLVPGRIAGLVLEDIEVSCAFWVVHNFGLTVEDFARVKARLDERRAASSASPLNSCDFWGGDFNILLNGELPVNVLTGKPAER